MAITESQRYEMYQGLEQALGRERADTLMEHLPPVGWADVATKHDLDLKIDALESRLQASLERALRLHTLVMVAVMGTLTSVATALNALL